MTNLYAAIVLPHFAAQAALRLRPHLAATAVALLEGTRPHEHVYSASPVALAAGLLPGMTRVEVESFSAVTILPRSLAEEAAAADIVLEAAAHFTPRTEPVPSATPNWECLLDVTGTERLLGTPAVLGRSILDHLLALGFTAHVALCGNPDAALSLARAGKLSVTTVTPNKLRDALSPLPLDVLNLGGEEAERFATWGLHTLGELANLPERDLITRLGQSGRRLLLRARGELPHLLQPQEIPFRLFEALDFEEPVETLEPLLFCINPMLQQLILRAQTRAYALAAVTISLTLERNHDRTLEAPEAVNTNAPCLAPQTPVSAPLIILVKRHIPPTNLHNEEQRLAERIQQYGRLPRPSAETSARVEAALQTAKVLPLALKSQHTEPAPEPEPPAPLTFTRTIRPAIPTLDRPLLLKMLQLDLEAHPPDGAVVRLELTAEPGDTSRIQLGLFAPPMPEPTRFEDTYARIISVVGEGNAGRITSLDTNACESFRIERFKLPAALTLGPEPRQSHSVPTAALRRMRPSVELRVSVADRQLRRFIFEARTFNVVRCYGPWRSSGDWWRPEVWSADTWDLAARPADAPDDGELLVCLVAHDLLRDRWLLEGIYD
jgi:nucleotidyltransferase/DNA polymerase involved in DNA repair